MSDVTIESIAAELAELVYDRWMASAAAGYVIEFAGIEALVTLIDALRMSATDPQTGAATMQAAIEVLREIRELPDAEEFQRALVARIAGSRARCVRRTSTQG